MNPVKLESEDDDSCNKAESSSVTGGDFGKQYLGVVGGQVERQMGMSGFWGGSSDSEYSTGHAGPAGAADKEQEVRKRH